MILNRAKDYYENNKDELRLKARNKYRELSEDEKDIKREYGRNRYHDMSEEDKQRLKEYQKIIIRLKNQHIFYLYFFFFFHCIKMRKELVGKIKIITIQKTRTIFLFSKR